MKIEFVEIERVKAARRLTAGEVKRRQRVALAYVESDGKSEDFWLLDPSPELTASEAGSQLAVKLRPKDLEKREAAHKEKKKDERRRQAKAKSADEHRPDKNARERDKRSGLTVVVKPREAVHNGEFIELKANEGGTEYRLNAFGADGVFQSYRDFSRQEDALTAFEQAKESPNESWRKPSDYRELAIELIATKERMKNWPASRVTDYVWPPIPQRLGLLAELANQQEKRDLAEGISPEANVGTVDAERTQGESLRATIIEILGDVHLPSNHFFYEEYVKDDILPRLIKTGSLKKEGRMVRENRVDGRLYALREIMNVGAKFPSLFPFCGGVLAHLTDKKLMYKQKEKYRGSFLEDRHWKFLSDKEFSGLLQLVLEKLGVDKFNFLIHMVSSGWRPDEGVRYLKEGGVSLGDDGKRYPWLMKDEIRYDYLMPNVQRQKRLINKKQAKPAMNPRASLVSYFMMTEGLAMRGWSRNDFATNYRVSLRKNETVADVVARRLRATGLTYVYYSQTTKDPRFYSPGNRSHQDNLCDIVMQRGGHNSRKMGQDIYAYMVPDTPVDQFFRLADQPLGETKLLLQDPGSGEFYDLMVGHYLSDAVLLWYFYQANTQDFLNQVEKDEFDAKLLKAYFRYMKVVHARTPEPVPMGDIRKGIRVVSQVG